MTIETIVRIEHARMAGMCSRGVRLWIERHGLNYMRFVREGYPSSLIEHKNDALGQRVVEMARRQQKRSTAHG